MAGGSSLDAQGAGGLRATGRILRGGPGGGAPRPAAGVWAVVHRIGRGEGGPVDSVRTDAAGRYAIRISQIDSTAIYVVSGWHAGIAYFSEPLQLGGSDGRLGPNVPFGDLVVYDTASAGVPVQLEQRVLTIAHQKDDGTRDVLEIVRLLNAGNATLISHDTLRPVWQWAIPREAIQWQVGESDVSADAVRRRGDTVALFAPLAPGAQGKQLSYGYVLPAGVTTLTVPVDQPTGELDFLLEDTAAVVVAPDVVALGVDSIEQRWFARYRAGPLPAGAIVTVTLPPGRFRPQRLLPYAVGLIALALVAGLVFALRRTTHDARLHSGP